MKKDKLKKELDSAYEFEIAETILSQSPRRLENIFRILNNKMYERKISRPTISS